jgi:hypothetical protein
MQPMKGQRFAGMISVSYWFVFNFANGNTADNQLKAKQQKRVKGLNHGLRKVRVYEKFLLPSNFLEARAFFSMVRLRQQLFAIMA